MANNITRDGTNIDVFVPEYSLEVCDSCEMEFPEPNAYTIARGVFCSFECAEWDMVQ